MTAISKALDRLVRCRSYLLQPSTLQPAAVEAPIPWSMECATGTRIILPKRPPYRLPSWVDGDFRAAWDPVE